MKTHGKFALVGLALALGTLDGAIAPPQARAQETMPGDVSPNGPVLYFRPSDNSVMMCATPTLAASADLIAHEPQPAVAADAAWLKTRIDDKDCAALPAGQPFIATIATPVYAGVHGAIWVVSVFSPETPGAPPVGFVPLDRIVFVPPQKD